MFIHLTLGQATTYQQNPHAAEARALQDAPDGNH